LSVLVALGLVATDPAGGFLLARPQGTVVFASDRSGNFEIYSVRADGSQLGQLTRNGVWDWAPVFSPDGRRIMFIRAPVLADGTPVSSELWVMNADGSSQRRLARSGYAPAWAPDSKQIAYGGNGPSLGNEPLVIESVGGGRIVVPSFKGGSNFRPSWSPDGRRIVFLRSVHSRNSDLMVVGSNGRGLKRIRRDVVGLVGWSPSPARAEIVFSTDTGFYAVAPDGRGVRRLRIDGNGGAAWSPDGRRLALAGGDGRLRVASGSGTGPRDITPKGAGWVDGPAWSPDGSSIVVRSLPSGAKFHDLLVVAADGSSSQRITARIPRPDGSENLAPSWRPRGATPARLGAAPVAPLPSETVSATAFQPPGSGSISELAADGGRAAVIVASHSGCAGVEVWEPARRRAVQLQRACGPNSDVSRLEDTQGVALAGTRAAWLHLGGGNSLETDVLTATLARPTPMTLADEVSNADDGHGDSARRPFGHAGMLAFTADRRCDADGTLNGRPEDQCPPGRKTGDVVAATVWRIGGPQSCPSSRPPPGCSRVLEGDGERTVLGVDAHRIVVRTENGVDLITASGGLLREFPVENASAASLSGQRLALRSAAGIEIYDTNSGKRTVRYPAAQLEDLEGDILVTAAGSTITLRTLSESGRMTKIHASGVAHAQLEPPGLFVATSRRVTFTPIKDIRRRLGG
jgi:TolB protein